MMCAVIGKRVCVYIACSNSLDFDQGRKGGIGEDIRQGYWYRQRQESLPFATEAFFTEKAESATGMRKGWNSHPRGEIHRAQCSAEYGSQKEKPKKMWLGASD